MKSMDNGEVLGKMWVARCYYSGRCNFPKDESKAIVLAKEVIEKIRDLATDGNDEAMFLLGSAYHDGFIVDKDLKLAMDWYTKSSMKGNYNATNNLGAIHLDDKNYDEAIILLEKGADRGNAISLNTLGQIYGTGMGVAKYEKNRLSIIKALLKEIILTLKLFWEIIMNRDLEQPRIG
ncbi:MAG: sel1 repeat family protein [Desulfobacterales bacterium]|nr:sel1 repeat family protein [Desulfobacterales bacterium]